MTLEMKGIYKSFGANDVLRDVSFTLNGGEICALLGAVSYTHLTLPTKLEV